MTDDDELYKWKNVLALIAFNVLLLLFIFAVVASSSDYYMYSPFYQLKRGGEATGIFAAFLNSTQK